MTVDCTDAGLNFPDVGERLSPVANRHNFDIGQSLPLDELVYFPLDGIASVLLQQEKVQFQVGFAKRGDVIGLQRLFVTEAPPLRAITLRGGSFLAVPAEVLSRLMREDRRLRDRLSGYAMRTTCSYLDEAAQAVGLTLERRVARWICHCRDAIGTDVLPVTHQELAASLGVRRSGVTVALHVLEGEHLIRSRRRRIEVVDQGRLRTFLAAPVERIDLERAAAAAAAAAHRL